MVFFTGLVGNLNHIVFGTDTDSVVGTVEFIWLAMTVVVVLLAGGRPFTICATPGWCRPSGGAMHRLAQGR